MLDASKAHLPNGESGSQGNADVSSWCYPGRSSLIPIWRALSPRNSLTFSFILPYLSEMRFVDNPWIDGFSETTMRHSRQASVNTFPYVSLFTKDDDIAKTATAQYCFWQKWFRHFCSIATSSFDGIYPWSKHCIGGWFGQILFLSAVLIVFHSR